MKGTPKIDNVAFDFQMVLYNIVYSNFVVHLPVVRAQSFIACGCCDGVRERNVDIADRFLRFLYISSDGR